MGQVPSTLRGCYKDISEREITPWYPVLTLKKSPKEHFKTEGECFEFINEEEKEEDREMGAHFTYSFIERYHGENFFSHALIASHHKAVISDSALFVTYPEYNENVDAKWVFPGTETPFQSFQTNSWMKCIDSNTALMPDTRRLLVTLEQNEHTLLMSPMYGSYMNHSSDLLDGLTFWETGESAKGLLFQGSAKAASLFADRPEHIHRVTLDINTPKTVDWASMYESCSEVFLNDYGYLTRLGEIGLPNDGKFFQEINYCFNRIQNKLPVLVHCSQGQSRSGLFVSILIMLLHLKGVVRLPDDGAALESEALFYRSAMWVSGRHPPLHFSEVWHTFVDFFIAYNLYLDKFFSFPKFQ